MVDDKFQKETEGAFRKRLDGALNADAILSASYTAFRILRFSKASDQQRAVTFEAVKDFLSKQNPDKEVIESFSKLENSEKILVLSYLAEWNAGLADALIESAKDKQKLLDRTMAYSAINGQSETVRYFLDTPSHRLTTKFYHAPTAKNVLLLKTRVKLLMHKNLCTKR